MNCNKYFALNNTDETRSIAAMTPWGDVPNNSLPQHLLGNLPGMIVLLTRRGEDCTRRELHETRIAWSENCTRRGLYATRIAWDKDCTRHRLHETRITGDEECMRREMHETRIMRRRSHGQRRELHWAGVIWDENYMRRELYEARNARDETRGSTLSQWCPSAAKMHNSPSSSCLPSLLWDEAIKQTACDGNNSV